MDRGGDEFGSYVSKSNRQLRLFYFQCPNLFYQPKILVVDRYVVLICQGDSDCESQKKDREKHRLFHTMLLFFMGRPWFLCMIFCGKTNPKKREQGRKTTENVTPWRFLWGSLSDIGGHVKPLKLPSVRLFQRAMAHLCRAVMPWPERPV
jgi:hypothetical protein